MKNLPFSPDILPDKSSLSTSPAQPRCDEHLVIMSYREMTGAWSSVTRGEGGTGWGGSYDDVMSDRNIFMTRDPADPSNQSWWLGHLGPSRRDGNRILNKNGLTFYIEGSDKVLMFFIQFFIQKVLPLQCRQTPAWPAPPPAECPWGWWLDAYSEHSGNIND